MSQYTTFSVISERNSGSITFDNLPSAMRYMDFCKEEKIVADLWSHTYAWDGTPLFSAELMSVNLELYTHRGFNCDALCSCGE